MIKNSNYDILRHFLDKKGLFSANFNQNLNFFGFHCSYLYYTNSVKAFMCNGYFDDKKVKFRHFSRQITTNHDIF